MATHARARIGRWSARAMLLAAGVVVSGHLAGCESGETMRVRGSRAYQVGNYTRAQDDFQKSVDQNPGDWLTQYKLGLTNMNLGQPVAAQLAFERALTLKEADPKIRTPLLDSIAEAIYQQHRPDALADFLKHTTERYGTTRDYLRQARYLVRIGDTDAAKDAYQKAAYFADPGNPKPYLAIADFYHSIGDVPDAVQALKYAYYVAPNDPVIADRFRRYGIVPGPTLSQKPPKPKMLREK